MSPRTSSEGLAESLDATVRRADPDRWLASRFVADREARSDMVALLAFDQELSRALAVTSTELLAEIRLAWWREVLDEVFEGRPVRGHPVATALAAAAARRRLPRPPLEAMIDGRVEALGVPVLDADAAGRWANAVGGSAAWLAALILDPWVPREAAAPAGQAWELLRLRRSGRAAGETIDDQIARALGRAAGAARGLSPAAFPAIACATLARSGDHPSAIETRMRLVWAVARGRL